VALAQRKRLDAVAGNDEPRIARRRVRVLGAGFRHAEIALLQVPERRTRPTALRTPADGALAAVYVHVPVELNYHSAGVARAERLQRGIAHDHIPHYGDFCGVAADQAPA